MSYDIIGDIHGQFNKLTDLLIYLGYFEQNGVWQHPTRKAVFVGDLIDGKAKSESISHLKTVQLVRKMVESEYAHCILGNHEFNAIAWITEDSENPGEYLRPHTENNNKQHKAFLDEVTPFSVTHYELTEWFKTLPLWLELEAGIRVIHAAWIPSYQEVLRPHLNSDNTLTENLLFFASKKGSPEYEALEILCKGLEVSLPEGVSFVDKHGINRTMVRVPWWLKNSYSTYKHEALVAEEIRKYLPEIQMVPDDRIVEYDDLPVFVGHYWLNDLELTPLATNIVCVDFSAGRDGPLVAYRWNGEFELSTSGFVYKVI